MSVHKGEEFPGGGLHQQDLRIEGLEGGPNTGEVEVKKKP